jgi:hypothetical protein
VEYLSSICKKSKIKFRHRKIDSSTDNKPDEEWKNDPLNIVLSYILITTHGFFLGGLDFGKPGRLHFNIHVKTCIFTQSPPQKVRLMIAGVALQHTHSRVRSIHFEQTSKMSKYVEAGQKTSTFKRLKAKADNKTCFDCPARNPTW